MKTIGVDFTGSDLGLVNFPAFGPEVVNLIRSGAMPETLVVIDRGYSYGAHPSVCVVRDHVNLTGSNPLTGPNHPCGTRFPRVTDIYQTDRLELPNVVVAGLKQGVVPDDDDVEKILRFDAHCWCYNLVHTMIVAAHAGIKVVGLLVPDGVDCTEELEQILSKWLATEYVSDSRGLAQFAPESASPSVRLAASLQVQPRLVAPPAALSVAESVKRLRRLTSEVPVAAIALGSGVEVLEDLSEQRSYPFQEIFGIGPSVEGHSGSISLGKLDGHLVAILRGRFHYYEGHSSDTVALPTRVVTAWGVPDYYLTNACGAINAKLNVGDLMLLRGYRDHLSPNWRDVGMLPAIKAPPTDCQSNLSGHIWMTAAKLAFNDPDFRPLHQGVYAGWSGPCYETLAEINMLRSLGADVVGMSTVPELAAARGTKTKTAAISVITNSWNHKAVHGHEEVLKAAKAASQRLDKILRAAILGRRSMSLTVEL